MVYFGLISQKIGGNQPYLYCKYTSVNQAHSMCNAKKIEKTDSEWWVQEVSDESRIGDEIDRENVIKEPKKEIDHYAVPKGHPLKEMKNQHHAIAIPQKAIHEIKESTPLPSLKDISDKETSIHEPGNYEVVHIAEIREDKDINGPNVYLNGCPIAYSPKWKRNKKGKDIARTLAEKLRFCKAVVYFLINDEENLKEHIARIQPLVKTVVPELIPVEIPDYISAYTPEAITGYPDIEPAGPICTEAMDPDIEEMMQDNDGVCGYCRDMGFTLYQWDTLDREYNDGVDPLSSEIIAMFEPAPVISAKIPGWVPYLKLSIREVALV